MTKNLRDYITETESTQDHPASGDHFSINIREECLLETAIVDVVEDSVILEADDRFMEILESYGMLSKDSRDAIRSAISRRIMSHHMDLLSRHGIDRVLAAIDDAADYYGNGDLDEIGTSDVSAFVNLVRQGLEGSDRVDELSSGRVERYMQAAQRDMARHAAAAKTRRHVHGPEDWQAQEHEREADRRECGLERAQRRMQEQNDIPGFMGVEEDWVEEGAMKAIAIQYQDWKRMSPREFFTAYRVTKDAWMAKYRDIVKATEAYELDEMRRRAGLAEGDISQREKDIADAPVRPIASMEGSCVYMREVLDRLGNVSDDKPTGNAYEMGHRAAALYHKSRSSNPFQDTDPSKAMEWEDGWCKGAAEEGLDEAAEYDVAAARASRDKIDRPAVFRKQERFLPSKSRDWQASLQDLEQAADLHRREFATRQKEMGIDEAEYQGREVALGKPMQGDVKKFKVYVKDPKTGNVKKVNFGDPNMRIKKSNPARRRSFRARHNCDTAKDRTSARYWSCRKW